MSLLVSFLTLFLQLYMFRVFLAHLQDLVCYIGSCWLDKGMCAGVVWSPVVSSNKMGKGGPKHAELQK
jgi:hypothetical protein